MTQLIRHPVVLVLTTLAASILLAALAAPTVRAADPAFVGILALAVDDKAAQQLELTDEVREKLRGIVERRENEAVNLALSIRDLPPDVRAERLAPFVAESERLGMELLTQEQRSKLNQLRLQRAGMASLAEPDAAKLLGLTPDQVEAIERLMAERTEALTRGGATEQQMARGVFERQLRSVLSSAQKATWDQMAGVRPGSDQVAAAETQTAPAAAPTTPPAAGAPIEEDPAATAAPAPAPATDSAAVVEPPAEGTPRAESMADAPGAPADEQLPPETAVAPAAGQGATVAPPAAPEGHVPAAPATVTPPTENVPEAEAPKNVKLRFNFRYQPWEDVLDWLAEQADLSLQSSIVPEGTFNYSDTYEYTPTEAIDLINGVLLDQGYTLVRRGRLLTVRNLEDDVPDVMVEFVPVDKLDERGDYELVKTVFHLAKMEPADAEQEIQSLIGPGRKMVVMPKSRQIMVTETGATLRMIRDVIENAENPKGIRDKGVTVIQLQFVSPEELLVIARPLVGLEEGKDVGAELSLALDPLGKTIYATGSREKIEILQDLVSRVDVKRELAKSDSTAIEQPQLMSHQVVKADLQQVLAVLQTLLAGLPDVRLGADEKTTKIIALARPSEQRTIVETIKQMEGETATFEVIQLKRIDPQIAVATITKFLAAKEGDTTSVIVDADPLTMKLYVKAPPRYMAEVRGIIENLEGPAGGGSGGGNLRFIPMTGNSAVEAVEMAQRLWRGPNQIRMTTPSESGPGTLDLREIWPEEPADPTRQEQTPPAKPRPTSAPGAEPSPSAHGATQPARDRVTVRDVPAEHGQSDMFQLVSFPMTQDPADPTQSGAAGLGETPVAEDVPAERTAPPAVDAQENGPATGDAPSGPQRPGSDIRIEFTPNGILLSSDDTAALDQFEEILRTVAGPQTMGTGKNFTVYFLKHCKADVARQLISDILGGTTSGGGGGSAIGDVAANLMGGGGGILGAILGGGGGGDGGAVTTVQATGPVSIVADTRLNCLVVQALPVDLPLIEQLLKVVDREGSITEVETAGKPHVLPIRYLQADSVAAMVREAFAGRMATASGGQPGGQPNPVELIRALRGGRGGRGDTDVRNEEAKMTITVDQRSNSLIVTAPEPLYQQVEEFVTLIDQGSPELEEDFAVVSLKGTNPDTVQRALTAIIGTTSSQSATSRSATGPRTGAGFQFGMPFGAASQGGGMPNFGGQRGGMGGMPNFGGQPGGMGGMPNLGGQRGGMGGMPNFGGQRGGMGGQRGGTGGNRGGGTRGGTGGGRR